MLTLIPPNEHDLSVHPHTNPAKNSLTFGFNTRFSDQLQPLIKETMYFQNKI